MYRTWNNTHSHPFFGKQGHPFGHFGNRHGFGAGFGFRRPKYNVPVNIAETDSAFEVFVYALGFSKENITVSVADGVLRISGTRTPDENSLPRFISQEYPVKSFERVVRLTAEVDTAGISARQENGVLIVTLPKTAEAQKPVQEVNIS